MYTAANVDEPTDSTCTQNCTERDNETFKLEASVSGNVGTVNTATPSTVTIVNSDETDIVLTAVATPDWNDEGHLDSFNNSVYWVIEVAKNHVNWAPANGNITIKLERTGGTLSSDEYETDAQGNPKFTCWNKYPNVNIDSTFVAADDANVLTTGITGVDVAAGHQCAIDGNASFDSVFLRLRTKGDRVREDDETISFRLVSKVYHSDANAPAVKHAPGETTPTVTLRDDDYERVQIEWIDPPTDANDVPRAVLSEDGGAYEYYDADFGASVTTASALKLRAVLVDNQNTGQRANALSNVYVTLALEDPNDSGEETTETEKLRRRARLSKTQLLIPKGASQSTETVTLVGIDNDFADDHLPRPNKSRPEVRVYAYSPTGVWPNGNQAASVYRAVFKLYNEDEANIRITGPPLGDYRDEGGSKRYEIREGGDAVPFDIVLTSQPSGNVTLTLSKCTTFSSPQCLAGAYDTDFTIDKTSLTFTPQNWRIPRAVTVTSGTTVDDDAFDAYGEFGVSSSDGSYSIQDGIAVVEVDHDAGVTQTGPNAGWGNALTLTEGGTTASYNLKLDAQPKASNDGGYSHVYVEVSVTGDDLDATALTLDASKCDSSGNNQRVTTKHLTFTTNNWNTNQAVTVKACEDTDIASGSVRLKHTIVGDPTNTDNPPPNAAYARLTPSGGDSQIPDVAVGVEDNDAPAVRLVLRDGPGSTDTALDPAAVAENGGVAYVTATLTTAVTSAVTVTVSDTPGQDTSGSEYSLSGSTLTIAAGATASTETVTITGVDDEFDDGDKTVLVSGTVASSASTTGPAPVALTLTDDEQAGIVVSNQVGLPAVREGGAGSYQVQLAVKPGGDVDVTPVIPAANAGSATEAADVTITPPLLRFTDANWDQPQTFTVTATFDDDTDDVASFNVTHEADSFESSFDDGYSRLAADRRGTVAVSVTDASAAVSLSATALEVAEGGGSPFPSYSAVLTAPPAASETVTVTVGWATTPTRDTDLRFVAPSACPSTTGDATKALTFTASNWFEAKEVSVCAAEEVGQSPVDEAAGTAVLTHTVTSSLSTGSKYAGISVGTVRLTEADNDAERLWLALTPSQPSLAAHGEVFLAEGADASSGPSLKVTMPTAPQHVTTITAEVTGGGFAMYDPENQAIVRQQFTLDSSNHSTGFTIKLGSAADADATANTGTLSFSGFANLRGQPQLRRVVKLVQVDDDTAGLEVSPRSLAVREGSSGSYRMRLTSAPSATVRVYPQLGAHPDDLAANPDARPDPQLRVNTGQVTFTSSNWSTWRTVNVSAGSDWDSRSGRAYVTHLVASSDDRYHGIATGDADVVLLEADDDVAGVVVSGGLLDVPEGGSATYTVALSRRPTKDVAVQVRSQTTGDGGDASLTADTDPDTAGDQSTLSFTSGNWWRPQTVTVSAASDNDTVEGTRDFTHTMTSDDINFVKSDRGTVTATEVEPGVSPGVVISPSSLRLETVGQTEYLTVWLTKAPSSSVKVSLVPQGNATVIASPQQLTFTTTNWNTPQVVSVRLAASDGGGGGGGSNSSVRDSGGASQAQAQAGTGPVAQQQGTGGGTAPTGQTVSNMSVHVSSNDSGYSDLPVGSVPLTDDASPVTEPEGASGASPGGSAAAPGASARSRAGTERVAGDDRFATSAALAVDYVTALAAAGSAADAGAVIVASGEDYPDALAAAALSRRLSAPILLTPRERLDDAVSGFVARHSITRVEIVGGAAAVSDEVEAALRALPGVATVRRHAGADRYATAAEVAKAADSVGMLCSTGKATAILASGTSFADAMIAGPLAYRGKHPVLLTEPDALPAVTLDYLRSADVAQVLVVGGEAVVSAGVRSVLRAAGIEVVGVGGADRYGTAASLGRYVTGLGAASSGAGCFTSAARIGLASGLGFADALAAAPLLGEMGAPLLLTDRGASVPAETLAYVSDRHLVPVSGVTPIIVIGGASAVPSAHVNQLADAADR